MRTRLALVLLWMSPVVAMAQRVSGTVRTTSGPSTVSGAVITTIDSAGRAIARTLSDGNGRYSLPLAPTAARVRAVRIGFRPITVDIRRSEGDFTIDLTMERAPVMLETVRVTSDGSCTSTGDGRLVLDVWEQARSALLAAIVAREASPARVQLLGYQRHMEVVRRLITEQNLVRSSGVSSRPVAAARTAAQLAATGYRGEDRDGQIYFAPDADVLFDDSFSETHCFGFTRGTRERNGQLGLTFRPRTPRRDVVDVDGVLWLGAQASELLQLDYRYTNVDPEANRVGVGGTMHFMTMPNGVVMIDSWSIVAPVMTEIRTSGGVGTVTRSVVNDLVETGGYVVDAAWPDGTKWSGPLGGIRGTVRARSGTPVEGVAVTAPGASVATDMTGAYSLPLPPGRYRLGLLDTAFAGYAEPRQQSREIVVGRADTVTADFEMPSREGVLEELCRGKAGPQTSILLGQIGERGGQLPDRLLVHATWVSSQGVSNTVALDRLRQANQVSEVSASGHFYVCGLPRESSWIALQLARNRTPIADTSIAPNSIDTPTAQGTRHVTWMVPSRVFDAAQQRDAAVLSGRVTRSGSPVAGAEVWVVFNDTTVETDSLGRYRVGGLSARQQIVQVRRIGYSPKRDSVRLKAHEETVKDFSINAIRELDTMRTVGKGRAYDVPRLQDFEKRRLSGMGGHFISEDELRKHEGRSVSDVIRTYVPGLRLVTDRAKVFIGSTSAPFMNAAAPSRPNGPVGCWATVYLDGVMLYQNVEPKKGEPPPPPPPDINQFLAMNLSGVEYYSAGMTPLQFKDARNPCGTLLLWTRGK